MPRTRGRSNQRRQVGHVEFLKWVAPPGRIMAVATVDGDEAAYWVAHGDCFVSPGVRCRTVGGRAEDIEIDHLGLCEATARVAARPVTWAVTSFEEQYTWANTQPHHRLLVEAAEARKRRRAGAPLEIVGHPDTPLAVEPGPLFRGAPGRFEPRRRRSTRRSARLCGAAPTRGGRCTRPQAIGRSFGMTAATGWTYGVT